MSTDELFLHCKICVDADENDDLVARVIPGFLMLECDRHEPAMLVARFSMDTTAILMNGCGALHPGGHGRAH